MRGSRLHKASLRTGRAENTSAFANRCVCAHARRCYNRTSSVYPPRTVLRLVRKRVRPCRTELDRRRRGTMCRPHAPSEASRGRRSVDFDFDASWRADVLPVAVNPRHARPRRKSHVFDRGQSMYSIRSATNWPFLTASASSIPILVPTPSHHNHLRSLEILRADILSYWNSSV